MDEAARPPLPEFGSPADRLADRLLAQYEGQRLRGIRWLRFAPAIEREFRAHGLSMARTRVLATVVLLIVFSAALAVLGQRLAPGVGTTSMLHAAVGFPATVLLLLGCLWRPLYLRQWPLIAALGSSVSGVTGAYTAAAHAAGGSPHLFPYLLVVIAVIYLALAIPFWWAMAAGLLVSAAYLAFALLFRVDPLALAFEGWILLAVNLVAIATSALGEASARRAFLDARILAMTHAIAARLAAIARQTANAVVITDAAGRIEWVNAAFTRMTGQTATQVFGRHPREVFPHVRRNAAEHVVAARSLARGEATSVEVSLAMPSGAEHFIHIDSEPLYDSSGNLSGFLAVGTDLTEQRRLEASLRSSAAFLRSSLDAISQHVAIVDERGTIAMVNRAWRDFAAANGGDAAVLSEGANYLDICDRGALEPGAAAIGGQLREALARGKAHATVRYPCHAPATERWFDARVAGFESDGRRYAVVLHSDVTDMHLAQREIERRAAQNRKLALVAEHTDDAVMITGADGLIQWVNPGFSRMLGYDLAEACGRRPEDLLFATEDQTARSRQEFVREIRAGRPIDQERMARTKRGTPIWLKREIRAVRDGGNVVTNYVAVMTNITERRAHDAEIRARERLLATVIDTVPHHVFWRDADGRYLGCNKAYARAVGLASPDPIRGLTDADLAWPPGDAERFRERDRETVERGRAVVNSERVQPFPDGRTLTVLESRLPIRDDAGIATGLVGVLIDISDLRRTQVSLQAAEERLKLAFQGSGDGVWDWNAETGRVFFSARWKELLGHDDGEIGDTSEEWISRIHPEDLPRVREAAKSHARGETEMYSIEYRMRHKDGSYRWMLMRGRIVHRAADGRPLRWVGTLSDQTEQKAVESDLATSRKLEAIGQLAAGIAHEINTPMQYIGDSVYFLRQSFDELIAVVPALAEVLAEVAAGRPPDANRVAAVAARLADVDVAYLQERTPPAFDRAEDGIARVTAIVQAMREFSRTEQRDTAPADINKALESTLVVARNEYKYVADVVTRFGELPPVECRIAEVNQVFLNLVVNAAHAIAEVVGDSGSRGQITVTTRAEPDWAIVEIADTGGGIPEAIQHRVFEVFFTTKPVGKGTGQGLAIARSIIVDKHGGTITFQSTPGVGTTFTIRLPVRPPEAAGQ